MVETKSKRELSCLPAITRVGRSVTIFPSDEAGSHSRRPTSAAGNGVPVVVLLQSPQRWRFDAAVMCMVSLAKCRCLITVCRL